jgi:hypothetical protein
VDQTPGAGKGIAALSGVQEIFNASCAVSNCHVTGGTAPMSLEAAASYVDLFGRPATTSAGTRVIPFNGTNSVLYLRVTGGGALAPMPPTGSLSTAQKDLIKKWIDQGASRSGVLNAVLSPDQAVGPTPVTSAARGTGQVTLGPDQTQIAFTLSVAPLPTTTINLAHIHFGAPGQNGGVIFNLLPAGAAFASPLTGTLTAANFTPVAGVATFAEAVNALLRGNTYFQIHTTEFPGGELRGQIGPAAGAAVLSTAGETLTTPSNGSGSAAFTLNSDQDALAFTLQFASLTGPATAAHIHKTSDSSVLVPLTGAATSPVSGILTVADTASDADKFRQAVDEILSGDTYVNVHTGANGGGEIRGDIVPAAQSAAKGTLVGFGSVKVNGVEFEVTRATRIRADDAPNPTEDNLKVGMVVNVKGVVDDNGVHGVATEIEFQNNVEGPITSALAAGQIAVMGKAVKLNDVTIFQGLTPADLTAGPLVGVSGIEQADGTILARRVERKGADDTQVEIKGEIASLTATTFSVAGLTVDFAGATIDNSIAAVGGLADGLFVEVKSAQAPAAGVLTATRVELDDNGVPENQGVEVRLEGLVTALSAAGFEVDGHPVTTDAQTLFKRGLITDVALGRSVEVEGVIGANGVLAATEVSFELARNIKIEADVDPAGVAVATVTVLGIQVAIDASTLLRDKSQADLASFALADLHPGERVKIRAFIDPDTQTVIATKLERDNAKDKVIVQGPVTTVTGNVVKLLGADFDLGGLQASKIKDAAGNQILVSGLANQLVKIVGLKAQDGTITWDRAEIEVQHEFENEAENEFEKELEIENEVENRTSSVTQLASTLSGAQVGPTPVTTAAAGTGTVVVSAARDSISFTLNVSPLPATAVTLAHIHAGAPGVNGGVIFNLLPAGTAFTGTLSGTLTAANFSPAGAVTTFAQAVDAILAGNTYFQVHTVANPGGELRGQIVP